MDDSGAVEPSEKSAAGSLPIVPVSEIVVAGNAAATIAVCPPAIEFDFDRVPAEHRGLLIATTNSIKIRTVRMANDAYFFGSELREIKKRLDHGLFLAWLDQAVGMSARTAERLMQVSRRVGGRIDSVSHLPITVIYDMTKRSVSDEILRPLLELGRTRKLTQADVDAALRPKAKVEADSGPNDALELLRELIGDRESDLQRMLSVKKIKGISSYLTSLMKSGRGAKTPRVH